MVAVHAARPFHAFGSSILKRLTPTRHAAMRLHEVLEASIDFIALDGVLGEYIPCGSRVRIRFSAADLAIAYRLLNLPAIGMMRSCSDHMRVAVCNHNEVMERDRRAN